MENNSVAIETKTFDSKSISIEERYLWRQDGIAGSLRVSRDTDDRGINILRLTGRTRVTWSVRSALGWGKEYRATFATLTEATDFANAKATVIAAWIAKQPERTGNGAVDVFSATVSQMAR